MFLDDNKPNQTQKNESIVNPDGTLKEPKIEPLNSDKTLKEPKAESTINPDGTLKEPKVETETKGDQSTKTMTNQLMEHIISHNSGSEQFLRSLVNKVLGDLLIKKEATTSSPEDLIEYIGPQLFQDKFMALSLPLLLENGCFFQFRELFRQKVSAKRISLVKLPHYQQILFVPYRKVYKLAEIAVLLEQDFIRHNWDQLYSEFPLKGIKESYWKVPLVLLSYEIPLDQLKSVDHGDSCSLNHRLSLYPISGYRVWARKHGLTKMLAYLDHTFGSLVESDSSDKVDKPNNLTSSEKEKKIELKQARILNRLSARPQGSIFSRQDIDDYVRFCHQDFNSGFNPANFREVFLKLSLVLNDGWFSQFLRSMRQAVVQGRINRFEYPLYQQILFSSYTSDYTASQVAQLLEQDFLQTHWSKIRHQFPLRNDENILGTIFLVSLTYQIPLNRLVLTESTLKALGTFYPSFLAEYPGHRTTYRNWAKRNSLTKMVTFLKELENLIGPTRRLVGNHIPSPAPRTKTEPTKTEPTKTEALTSMESLNLFHYMTQELSGVAFLHGKEDDRKAFVLAARRGHLKLVQKIYEKRFWGHHFPKESFLEALLEASAQGHLEVVKFLSQHLEKCGASPSEILKSLNYEPLILAAHGGHLGVLKFYIKKFDLSGDAVLGSDLLALRGAIAHGHFEMVIFLTCKFQLTGTQIKNCEGILFLTQEHDYPQIRNYLVRKYKY